MVWEFPGEQILRGRDAVEQWAQALPEATRLQFLSILTHGKEGSADGSWPVAARKRLSATCCVLPRPARPRSW
ncbi:hypothetical protein [Arthrobacter sp. MYb214]|uniref:hypothetical protein n=1 Tax=Arthrobacter sp. MYb214 TaxID=1848596 RepID=UPI00336A40AF